MPGNYKPEAGGLKGCSMNYVKESDDLVAGRDVLIVKPGLQRNDLPIEKSG